LTLPSRIAVPARRRTYRVKTPLSIGGASIRFLVELGVAPSGRPLEIFLVSGIGKSGSMLRAVGDDVAVACSHLMQAGYPLARVERMFAPGGLAQQACRVARRLAIDAWRETRAARRLGVRP
jgi:hypothetical protein